jgi:hypothetical protein
MWCASFPAPRTIVQKKKQKQEKIRRGECILDLKSSTLIPIQPHKYTQRGDIDHKPDFESVIQYIPKEELERKKVGKMGNRSRAVLWQPSSRMMEVSFHREAWSS